MQELSTNTQPDAGARAASRGGVDAVARLWAAALGSVHAAHYRAAFARMDAAGRPLPLWNSAAALLLAGWMAFRALWGWCFLTLTGSVAAGALLFGVWRMGLLPAPVVVGVALALWLVCAVACGMWGDALVYRHIEQRVQAAVAAAGTVQEAVQQLEREAPTRSQAFGLAAAGLGVLAALAWWGLRDGERAAPPQSRGGPVVQRVEVAPPPRAPMALVEQGVVPGVDMAQADAVQAATEAALAALAPRPGDPVAAPRQGRAPVQAAQARAPAAARPGAVRTERARAGTKDAAAAPTGRTLYIHVGIFADPANVQRVRAQLAGAGLPVLVDPLHRPGDQRLQRVRVGPFSSAARANEAAARIRALGLDAVPAADTRGVKE